MSGLWRPTHAEIDLKNIQYNYKLLKKLIPEDKFFCPMVKANGYGHGDVEVT